MAIQKLRRLPKLAYVAVAVAVLLTFLLLARDERQLTVEAHFSRAVAIYPGSEVRILGVKVGEVTAVVPEGSTVRVEMVYDADYPIPADAKAVIVTPSLTADRFVQLTPAYGGGPKLPDGGRIEVQDTGTPIELDRIYRSLTDLTRALGPNGVNKDGTLNEVLAAGSQFLDGQGKKANATLLNLSRALKTFGAGSGELFATVRALSDFTGALATNDAQVDAFMDNLGAVSEQLASDKDELVGALRNLALVLGKVESFVKDNRALVTDTVSDLASIMEIVAGQKDALETVLDVAPSAMGNLLTAYDPVTGTIGSRLNLQGNVLTLDDLLCTLVKNGGLDVADQACALFKTLLGPLRGLDASATNGPNRPVEPAPHATSADSLADVLRGR